MSQTETELISPQEVADRLGIHLQTAYSALKRGAIPCLHFGRKFVINRAAFNRWFEAGVYQKAVK